jgi:hypothetical protein
MNAEDALFPRLDENARLGADGAEVFDAAKVML